MKALFKTTIVLVLTMIITSFTSTASASDVEGTVVWSKKGCDYHIIETNQFFVLVEWYKGRLYEGDKVAGELHSYNFKNLKNKSRSNEEVQVYIENYWSKKDECFKWLKKEGKCGFEE